MYESADQVNLIGVYFLYIIEKQKIIEICRKLSI